MYFSFALYPNFIQSHAFLVGSEGALNGDNTDEKDASKIANNKNENEPSDGSMHEYSQLFNQIQEKNDKTK